MSTDSSEWHRRQEAFKGVKPGDTISFTSGGVTRTDTVNSVRYQDGDYIPAPPLSWWQKAVRAVTPRRWRKPLSMGTRMPGQYTVSVGVERGDPVARHNELLKTMQADVDRIMGY